MGLKSFAFYNKAVWWGRCTTSYEELFTIKAPGGGGGGHHSPRDYLLCFDFFVKAMAREEAGDGGIPGHPFRALARHHEMEHSISQAALDTWQGPIGLLGVLRPMHHDRALQTGCDPV